MASHDVWIWYANFSATGSNNDINVLNKSPLFSDIKNGNGPPAPFDVNKNHYTKGYYLANGIYPDWVTLIKAYLCPTDEKRHKFKGFQENARKDVEQIFGVLQGKWRIIKSLARAMNVNKIQRALYIYVILYNMIQEYNGFPISLLEEEFLANSANFVRGRFRKRVAVPETRVKEIRDEAVHDNLRSDLTEHIWTLSAYCRSM